MLAELMRSKYGITIAGTHGKTTTTSMVATILRHAGMDPTAVVGGRLNSLGSNAKLGTGDFMVVEADESDRSFLMLSPTLAIVTNIDEDHMESYSGLDDLKAAFVQFVNKVPFYGAAILCLDEANVQSIIPSIKRRIISYGFGSQADVHILNPIYKGFQSQFQLRYQGELLGRFNSVFWQAQHSERNGGCGCGPDLIYRLKNTLALGSFSGADRRFQIKGQVAAFCSLMITPIIPQRSKL